MTREEILHGLENIAAGEGLYDDRKPLKRALILGEAIKAIEQEPCEDCIDREEAKQFLYERLDRLNNDELYDIFSKIVDDMYNELSSVTPQPKMGHWIYDKSIANWICSECNETPKTMRYVGSADFMTEHFKFCNHCGAKMVEQQESEDNK